MPVWEAGFIPRLPMLVPMLRAALDKGNVLESWIGMMHDELARSEAERGPKLASLLRKAHTLKGSASTVGLNALSHLAHVTEELFKLLDKLEDLDAVQKVYANFEVSDEVMEKLAED